MNSLNELLVRVLIVVADTHLLLSESPHRLKTLSPLS